MKKFAVGLLALAALWAAPAAALDWPQFRFDDAHTGHNPLEQRIGVDNVARLTQAWAAQLGMLVFESSPVVVGGVAYIGSIDGRLWAYDAKGCGADLCTQPLWQSSYLAQIVDSPTIKDGIVYVGSQTSYDSNNGRLNAFSAAGCGKAVCEPLWQGRAGKESILYSSPTVADGVVYVGAYDGRLYAFAAQGCGAKMCDPLWTGKARGTIESTPLVAGGMVYVGADDGRFYAFDAAGCGAARCDPLWTGPLPGPAFGSSPALADGVIYIGAAHGLAAFAAGGCGASSCEPLWKAVDKNLFFGGSPAVANGRVYIALENELAVYDAAGCGQPKCQPLWLGFGAGAQAIIESSPTVANGVVYVGRNTGQVLAWKADGCGAGWCDAIWSASVPESIVNSSPTVVNGRLYIGSADKYFPESIQGRLYVFELP
jgi:outer membrane protein assembly factor BamB